MAELERITSRDNQRLVAARKLRDGKDRTRIFIEGVRLVEEAVGSDIAIEECFISDEFGGLDRFPELMDKTTVVADRVFSTISDTENTQGIVLLAQRPASTLEQITTRLANELPVVIYLKEINNPSNLGAIIRTAEAAGVAGVVTSTGSADPYSSKALRSSMGSAFRLPIVSNIDTEERAEWAQQNGLASTAADTNGTISHAEVDWRKPRLLIFGSEAHGLSETELGQVDETIFIPIESTVESLNLAVSAGIILFEARRQLTG